MGMRGLSYPDSVHIIQSIILCGYRKKRRHIVNPGVRRLFDKAFPRVMKSMPGCEIVQNSARVDHIQVVMIIPPEYSVSEVVGRIKGMTASLLRKKFS